MRIIKIIPCEKFGGSWTSFESPGVEPTFKRKDHAIDYAKTRWGGIPEGEIHVYDSAGEKIIEVIKMKGTSQY